jgi:hypothetical protein
MAPEGENDKPDDSPKKPAGAETLDSIGGTQRSQNNPQNKPRVIKRFVYNVFAPFGQLDSVGVFTGLLCLVAWWQAIALYNTDRTLKDTLASNQLEQRAWVAPSSFKMEGDLVFDKDAAELDISFVMNNTGKLPATNTMPWINLYIDPRTEPLGLSRRDGPCRKGVDLPDTSKIGGTIFPQQVGPPFRYGVHTKADAKIPAGAVIIVLAGCVTYNTPGIAKTLRTPFSFALHQDSGLLFDKAAGTVKRQNLYLFSLPTAGMEPE